MLIRILAGITCMLCATIASAQYTPTPATKPTTANTPTHGYIGPGTPTITTVAAARQAADDTAVILEGYITRRINQDDRYEFKDQTGTIIVEIDNDDWPGPVSDKTKVRLYGEVDKDLIGKAEIDVDHLEIIK